MPRVVVTGLGMLTPLGNDVESTWSALIEGRSGIRRIKGFDTSAYEHAIGGELQDFDPEQHIASKLLRRIDRANVLAITTAQQAVLDSRLDLSNEDPERVGVILGTGMGGAHLIVEQQEILNEKGPRRVSPFLVTQMLPDTATGLVAIALGARGPNFAITAACATGGVAIGEAAEIIARGDADIVIAGGFEAPLRPIYYAGFAAMKALGSHEDPAKAVRPFEANRTGFVVAEGAGVMILESLEHALARGATIRGEWRAAGSANDAFDMAAPEDSGAGIVSAMRRAMARAGLEPADIDYINAHGPGTPVGDRIESRAIRRFFGEHADALMVSSTKSMHGHMMGASGAVEAIVSLLTCERGIVPPTINYEQPDPDCDLDFVPNVARQASVRRAMSTSVGLGGHNSAIIFERWES
ncbi:MAG: beta-ketoacyl-[acyl-carrier-protein] synthase II [Dehalococcoidia bacterium]|nr:beta-ketoacyl-[acyl-carrier-protein] synthase II [Dehalococcoidia bacterium]